MARATGVHPSTAARALDPAQSHRISSEVVERVKEEAARQGYRRNVGAAALRTGRSSLIGVVLPDLANPVFSPILAGIGTALAEGGYLMLVGDGGVPADAQSGLVAELIARGIDGLILATVRRLDPVVDLCLRSGLPTVLVNRREDLARTPSVVSDDALGMRLAVEHLHALGHVRIGHVAGPQEFSTGARRRGGYEAAMAAAGLGTEAIEVADAYSSVAGQAAAAALLTRRPDLTAIVAANDLLALGTCQELRERGLRCPGDLSVTGHNDMPLVDLVAPPLTTVRIEHLTMGHEAARLVMRFAADHDASATVVTTPSRLVVRASSGPPP